MPKRSAIYCGENKMVFSVIVDKLLVFLRVTQTYKAMCRNILIYHVMYLTLFIRAIKLMHTLVKKLKEQKHSSVFLCTCVSQLENGISTNHDSTVPIISS